MTSPDKPLAENRSQSGPSAWQGHRPLQHVVAPNPASSPAPPGFQGASGDHKTAASDQSHSRSGPPPPGFIPDTSADPGRLATGTSTTITTRTPHNQGGSAGQMQGRKSSIPSTLPAEMAQMSGGRTSSFVNLAAVLGTGLAESMDDATKGDWSQQLQQNQLQAQGLQDLSLARQSRHAAARMIGASPPRVDHTLGLDVGGSFLGGGAAAPSTLAGGLHLTRDLQLGPSGNQQRQRSVATSSTTTTTKADSGELNNGQGVGGFLPSTFTSDSNEGIVMDQGQSNNNNNNRSDNARQREYSPLSMFGPNANRRGNFPMSKDVGVTVMEPACMVPGCNDSPSDIAAAEKVYNEDSGGVLAALMRQQQQGFCHDPQCFQQKGQQPQEHQYEQPLENRDHDTFEVERGMRSLWVDDGASLGEASRQSKNRRQQTQQPAMDGRSIASSRSGSSQQSRVIAEAEIRPFLWDTRSPQQQYQRQQGNIEPSRCLAILKAMHLQIPDIRSTCEAFGVVESFRSDFADRGIMFVSYYDIRSAQYAALDMEAVLRRRGENSEGGQDIAVYYCVPLNSSSQTDESRIVLSDVPPYVDQHSLLSMLSSYGAVRSLGKHGGYYGGSSFEVEFHNVQDAKQALLELSSTQPWGPDVAIEVGMRMPIDRKRGRELLSVIGRWRHGSKPRDSPTSSTTRMFEGPASLNHGAVNYRGAESSSSSSPALAAPADTTTQLVLGPDGRYSYVIVNNQTGYPQPPSSDYTPSYRRQHPHENLEQQRQQIVHGPNGEIYITTMAVPSHQAPSPHTSYRQGGGGRSSRDYWPPSQPPPHQSHYSNNPYQAGDARDRGPGPYYSHHVASDHRHGGHHHHHHNPHHPHSNGAVTTSAGGDEKDNKHLVLDLESVENGRDARTSLMVRNIPNKYTQQMLLAEFTENGLGPGVIDFFYLPIDFKNRCNRGYAFINFVDFKDILPFHVHYFGKHWSTFNSDKICDITYARIQGKAAMLKRFENSALMEKDEEYKPLVFISHGPEKGKRIPFPEAAAGANSGKS